MCVCVCERERESQRERERHTHTLTHKHTHMDSQAVVEGQRVVDLAVSRDGARLVTVCADKSIKIFTLPSMLQV